MQIKRPSTLVDSTNGGLLPLSCSLQWMSLVLSATLTSLALPEAIKSTHVLFCVIAVDILHIYSL
jgi:hypothetical protein